MGACHSEEDHMDFVLKRFEAAGACDATAGKLQKIAGHVYPAKAELYHSPVEGTPCVWYRTVIEEQVIHTAVTQRGVSHFNVWERLVVAEQVSDFYLKDGDAEVLVEGQNAAAKFQSACVGARNGVWSGRPPPGVGLLVETAMAKASKAWGASGSKGGEEKVKGAGKGSSSGSNNSKQEKEQKWWEKGKQKNKNKTGKFRYTEQAFDVNEIVCAFGVVTDMGGGKLIMRPVTADVEVDQTGWNGATKHAWNELLKEPHILLSDHPEQHEGAEIMDPTNVAMKTEFFAVAKTEQDFGLMFERRATQLEFGHRRRKEDGADGDGAATASDKVSPETAAAAGKSEGGKAVVDRLMSVEE